MPPPYAPGTRYSNSVIYDAATEEVVHGWQVFMEYLADGTPTGRKSFVNNSGILCGIEIAAAERERATRAAAPEMLAALQSVWFSLAYPHSSNDDLREWAGQGNAEAKRVLAVREAIAKAAGVTP